MSDTKEAVVLVGMNIRPLTRSAVMAGYDVTAIGVVSFLDIPVEAHFLSLMDDLGGVSPPIDVEDIHRRIARAARSQQAGAVAFSGGFENFPDLVSELGNDLELLGNHSATLEKVRDPFLLKEVVGSVGMETPQIVPPGNLPDPSLQWLRKPIKSGNGTGIDLWEGVVPEGDPGFIVQKRIDGQARSVSFIANGTEVKIFSHAEQLSGDSAFGSEGFGYVGNFLLPLPEQDLLARLNLLAGALTREFGLVGLNGIDFILNDGQVFVLEVNPRYSASMELVEDALGQSLFDWHVAGCRGQSLPELPEYPKHEVYGKASVLAKKVGVLPDTTHWLENGVRDVSHSGRPVFPRYPIGTVTASGWDVQSCYEKLVAKAKGLYEIMDSVEG